MALVHTVISLAIGPKTQADRDRLRTGLAKLMAEDPTIRMQSDAMTGEVIIAGVGELQLEVIIERLAREFHVEAHVGKPQVAYKETFTRRAYGQGRFVRQTVGRGQYAHVKLCVDPGGLDTGYVLQNEVVGGSIPQEYITSVDAGIKEALARGVLAGVPVDDVKVVLYDGSYHEADSSPAAFKIAGAMAFQDAAKKGRPVLLEPVMRVEATVPKEYVADVITDLTDRRGRIRSQGDRGDAQIVEASVPLAEMFGYRYDLHSRTRGRATYSIAFERYEKCPGDADGDDLKLPVASPRTPLPRMDSTIALPEPEEDGF